MTADCRTATSQFGTCYAVPTEYHKRLEYERQHKDCRGTCQVKRKKK